jgi:hypothetical protein
MSLLFDVAARRYHETNFMIMCKGGAMINMEESDSGLIKVLSRHLDRNTKARVPAECRKGTFRIQVCRITATPISCVYFIDLIHKFPFRKLLTYVTQEKISERRTQLNIRYFIILCQNSRNFTSQDCTEETYFLFTKFIPMRLLRHTS